MKMSVNIEFYKKFLQIKWANVFFNLRGGGKKVHMEYPLNNGEEF